MGHWFLRIVMVLFSTMFSLTSCKKALDLDSSHLVPMDEMWTSKNDARSAVFGTFGLFRSALVNHNAYLAYGELRTGDFVSVSDRDITAVTTNELNASSKVMEEWKNWRRFYSAIVQANLVLNKMELVQENDFRYNDEEIRLDEGNIRFLRALSYFYLARIWGDVPFITDIPNGDNFSTQNKMSKDSILSFVISESKAIIDLIPWQYNGEFPEQEDNYWASSGGFWKGRVATKGACYALIAHAYAWQGNYLEAIKNAEKITDNSSFSEFNWAETEELTNPDGGVFAGQTANVIFSTVSFDEYQESSSTGHIEEWTLAEPFIDNSLPLIYVPNDLIGNLFDEDDDERFFIDENRIPHGEYFTGFGNPIPVFSKIRLLTTSGDHPLKKYRSNIIIFRYEEIELLLAEAYYFVGVEDKARSWLNLVRDQRGLDGVSVEGDALGEAIFKERRRELLGEGWSWFDLVRWGKVPSFTRFSEADVESGALYWPIANSILEGNQDILQNPYWAH